MVTMADVLRNLRARASAPQHVIDPEGSPSKNLSTRAESNKPVAGDGMATAILVACAESASRDPQTNNISLVRLVEELSASSFPTAVSIAFVAMLAKGAHEPDSPPAQLVIRLNDAILFEVPLKVSFGGKSRATTILNLRDLPIPGPGHLILSAKVGNQLVGSWPIKVNEAKIEKPHGSLLLHPSGESRSAHRDGAP